MQSFLAQFFDFLRETVRGKTFVRILINQALRMHVPSLHGRVIDIGGGGASYERYLDLRDATIVSTNIDLARNPDLQHDANQPFPFEEGTFDAALCICTIHILKDTKGFLREVRRMLKPGHKAYIVFPFIFPFNPEPEDYWRMTPSGFRVVAEAAGLSLESAVPIANRASSAENFIDHIFVLWPIKAVMRSWALLLDATVLKNLNELHPAPSLWLFVVKR